MVMSMDQKFYFLFSQITNYSDIMEICPRVWLDLVFHREKQNKTL